MTDYGEPWDNQGHHSNIYDANGNCIATVFNHRAHIIKCVNRCYGINPDSVPMLINILKTVQASWAGYDSYIPELDVILAKAYEEEQ